MKAIILARVSTEEQMNEGQSIPAQLERARKYTKKKDLEIKSEYQFNESSLKDQRVKFDEVIKEIKQSKEKIALIVETVDRLQRSFKESVLLDELRKEDKVELHFIRENLIIHNNSNSSEIQRWDLAVFVAKSYVLQISDNVKRTIEQKIKKGEVIGKAPIGYINTTELNGNKTVKPDPERADLIKKIFELYSTGDNSMQKMADTVAKEGLRSNTPQRGTLKVRQIETILKNPFYYGQMTYKGQTLPHKYEPLINKELFDKCEQVRSERYTGKRKVSGDPYTFKGLIKCKRCGCSVTHEQAKGKYVYYHCTNYHNNCKKIYVKEAELTEPLIDILDKLKLPKDAIKRLIAALKKNEESKNLYNKDQLAKLQLTYDKIDKHLEVMYNDRLDGRLSTEEYDQKVVQYQNKREEIHSQIRNLKEVNTSNYITASKLLDLASRATELYQSSEVDEKRLFLKTILQNLELDGKNLQYELKTPYNVLFSYNTKTPLQREAFLWGA